MAAVLEKFRIPLGSLVVDGALVLFLAFTAGQMTNRFEAMDQRLISVEQVRDRENLAQRTAVLEQRAGLYDRDRTEILDSLRRIEVKLDGKQDKGRVQ